MPIRPILTARPVRPLVEPMEGRALFAATAPAVPTLSIDDNQTLHITGTPGSDRVDIRTTSAGMVVKLTADGSIRHRFAPGRIPKIEFDGRGGSDAVTLNATAHLATTTQNVEHRTVTFADGRTVTDFAVVAEPGTDAFNNDTIGPQHWLKRYKAQQKALVGVTAKTLFIGDSLLDRMPFQGRPQWTKLRNAFDSADLGFSGDTTSSLLYRLNADLLKGMNPKTIFVSVGTNNIALTDDAADTLRGIDAVMAKIHALKPRAKLILSSILPRGIHGSEADVDAVNAGLPRIAKRYQAVFSDASPAFAANRVRYASFVAVSIHLTRAGYARWLPVIIADVLKSEAGDTAA